MADRITYTHERLLQAIYNDIANRGVRIDPVQRKESLIFVDREITRNLAIASNQWNIKLYMGVENNPNKNKKTGDPTIIEANNINSTAGEGSLLKLLQRLGYHVPKIVKKDSEGNYETNYSTGELALQRMLRDNQFGYPTGDPAIKAVLAIRELGRLKSSYLNAPLYQNRNGEYYFLSAYDTAGTITGRRSSKRHSYGFGNNGQNHPKHSKTAEQWRKCIVARPNNIFLIVDQKGAEEWPVNALAQNHVALAEMRAGVNRHIKRAVFIFNIAEGSRTEKEWKDSLEYYLGKKAGHAGNYGMKAPRMSDSLIQEGYYVSVDACQAMLTRLHQLDPNIQLVFHESIKQQLNKTRVLKTPFGRERQFLGLRPNDTNNNIFNEAFAWIPQSVVGDNTGFAVKYICDNTDYGQYLVQDGHDSLMSDIPDNLTILDGALQAKVRAFKRTIHFDNGIDIEIPIEAEIGHNLNLTVKVKDLSYNGLAEARKLLKQLEEEELAPAVA